MFSPTVIELPPVLEPVSRDTFADGPEPAPSALVAVVGGAAGDAAPMRRLAGSSLLPSAMGLSGGSALGSAARTRSR